MQAVWRKDFWELIAIMIPLPIINKYMLSRGMIPRKPNSSAITENIKSVVLSGKKSNCPWLPLSQPFPNIPPDPMAIFDWIIWYPAPKGSFSGFKKVNTRFFWKGCILDQMSGNEAKNAAIAIAKYLFLMPDKKMITRPENAMRTAVPRSGSSNISSVGISTINSEKIIDWLLGESYL